MTSARTVLLSFSIIYYLSLSLVKGTDIVLQNPEERRRGAYYPLLAIVCIPDSMQFINMLLDGMINCLPSLQTVVASDNEVVYPQL